MTTTGPDHVDDYLARLDDALHDVPFGTAREIRAGVEEELASLPPEQRAQRIVELGDPAAIAAEAVAESQRPGAASAEPAASGGYGRGPGYVVVTAVLIGIGGVAVPVLGWLVGIVLLWTGRVWTRLERWIATLAPIVATAIVVGIWLLVQSAASGAAPAPATGSGFHAPEVPVTPGMGRIATLWMAWIGTLVGNAAIAVWLLVIGMRRTRA